MLGRGTSDRCGWRFPASSRVRPGTHRSQPGGFGSLATEGEENALPGEVRPFAGVLAGRVWQVEVGRRRLARTSYPRLRLGVTDGALAYERGTARGESTAEVPEAWQHAPEPRAPRGAPCRRKALWIAEHGSLHGSRGKRSRSRGSSQRCETLFRAERRRSVRGPALIAPRREENTRRQRWASWPKRVERRETRNPPATRGLVPPSEPVATRHAGARL